MTLPRKDSRQIIVDGVPYRWILSPNDGYMVLVVEATDHSGQQLHAYFRYHNICKQGDANSFYIVGQRRSVTPRVVEVMIRAALNRGWQPFQRGLQRMSIHDTEELSPVNSVGDET